MVIISKADLREYRNQGRSFSKSVTDSLNEWVNESKANKVTIFLSHKHDEDEELDAAITLLKNLGVEIYVDWQDDEMPKNTNGYTARMIKKKIRENDKFILLATEAAVASKWCNWELGYGDSQKYKKHLAIFPIRNSFDPNFSGNEYLAIYPSIEKESGKSKDLAGNYIPEGYYVFDPPDKDGNRRFESLRNWLNS